MSFNPILERKPPPKQRLLKLLPPTLPHSQPVVPAVNWKAVAAVVFCFWVWYFISFNP